MKKTIKLIILLLFFAACSKPERVAPLYTEIDSLVWIEYYKLKAAGSLDTVFYINIQNTEFVIKESKGLTSVILKR